jgi:hypothetical protein
VACNSETNFYHSFCSEEFEKGMGEMREKMEEEEKRRRGEGEERGGERGATLLNIL